MTISKIVFAGCVATATMAGIIAGFLAGKTASDKKNQSRIEEAEAMMELWKRRCADNMNCSDLVEETPSEEENEPTDYTKYYSRKDFSENEPEEEEDVVQINPRSGRNEPPRIVSQDEAMSPDSDCIELEYHVKDEALIDPNTPGKPDLIDETDAFMMIGNLLRVPDPNSLPKTVYIYCPVIDQYYEIFIYDNYWDPPDEEDDSPRVEKIRKRRFSDE